MNTVLMFQAERAGSFFLGEVVQLPLDVVRNARIGSLAEHLKALDSETRVVLEHRIEHRHPAVPQRSIGSVICTSASLFPVRRTRSSFPQEASCST